MDEYLKETIDLLVEIMKTVGEEELVTVHIDTEGSMYSLIEPVQ